jgi:hypothetical protein
LWGFQNKVCLSNKQTGCTMITAMSWKHQARNFTRVRYGKLDRALKAENLDLKEISERLLLGDSIRVRVKRAPRRLGKEI